jgi:hypothetical protein
MGRESRQVLVGVAGFEPATPRPERGAPSECCYAPGMPLVDFLRLTWYA